MAKKSVSIDPESDEANDLFQDVTLKFKALKHGELQIVVFIYDDGDLIEKHPQSTDFFKNKKTYKFEFDGLVSGC